MRFPFSVSVVMPAFNEAENLPETIQECTKTLSTLTNKFEIIVVDDCSTDITPQVLNSLKQNYPCLKVIRNENNVGCHPSTLVGLREAFSDVSIILPADRQIPPTSISKFLFKINDFDLVCSYRHQRADNFIRHFASRLYNFVLKICFDINLHDTHSAIAVKQKVIRTIVDGDEIQSNSSFAGCELILRALTKGYRVTEIEINHLPRISGKAKGANLRDAIWTPINLLKFWWELQKNKNSRGIAST